MVTFVYYNDIMLLLKDFEVKVLGMAVKPVLSETNECESSQMSEERYTKRDPKTTQ